jgi:hypothetical protein
LRYAVYTLLETWDLEIYSRSNIHPKIKFSQISKKTEQYHKPSFEYRAYSTQMMKALEIGIN